MMNFVRSIFGYSVGENNIIENNIIEKEIIEKKIIEKEIKEEPIIKNIIQEKLLSFEKFDEDMLRIIRHTLFNNNNNISDNDF
jgi:hypothetical protein